MKILILSITFLLLSVFCFGQTQEIEVKNLEKMYLNKEFSQSGYMERGKVWKQLLADYGGYPDLPYNSEKGIIEFVEVVQFPNMSKKQIYDRVLEWAAIRFGSIDKVLHYQNYESGKIILKGYFNVNHASTYRKWSGKVKESITTSKCFQTYIITVKDNKIKVQITDLEFRFNISGYYNSTLNRYIPSREYDVSIHTYYPITSFDYGEWKEKLDLLFQTNKRFKVTARSIQEYISDYIDDYGF